MILLGITGRAKSGKSMVALGILKAAEAKGLTAKIFELSDYVLADLKSDGLVPKSATREDLKDNVSLLVERGMSRRAENVDHWVELLEEDLENTFWDVAIIPNVRFPNEATFIQEQYCVGPAGTSAIVRVTALVKDGISYISQDRDPNHISETGTHDIEADYFLTVKKGQTKLLEAQAGALLNYLQGEANN
jgi:hypothetical protein